MYLHGLKIPRRNIPINMGISLSDGDSEWPHTFWGWDAQDSRSTPAIVCAQIVVHFPHPSNSHPKFVNVQKMAGKYKCLWSCSSYHIWGSHLNFPTDFKPNFVYILPTFRLSWGILCSQLRGIERKLRHTPPHSHDGSYDGIFIPTSWPETFIFWQKFSTKVLFGRKRIETRSASNFCISPIILLKRVYIWQKDVLIKINILFEIFLKVKPVDF